MATSNDAVLAIRHVVQEHGDADTRLGGSGSTEGIRWFGRLLGWSWPPSYLEVIEEHDGVLVQDAIIYSFLESIDTFLFYHGDWHRPQGFWPIAGDGCGNFYALAFGHKDSSGECEVVFLNMGESRANPPDKVAESYSEFVVGHMLRQCVRVGCAH